MVYTVYKALKSGRRFKNWEFHSSHETIDDAEKADLVFTTLMGPEVAPRRKFIQTHAKGVKNLDI